jgi:hypothetical protein
MAFSDAYAFSCHNLSVPLATRLPGQLKAPGAEIAMPILSQPAATARNRFFRSAQ